MWPVARPELEGLAGFRSDVPLFQLVKDDSKWHSLDIQIPPDKVFLGICVFGVWGSNNFSAGVWMSRDWWYPKRLWMCFFLGRTSGRVPVIYTPRQSSRDSPCQLMQSFLYYRNINPVSLDVGRLKTAVITQFLQHRNFMSPTGSLRRSSQKLCCAWSFKKFSSQVWSHKSSVGDQTQHKKFHFHWVTWPLVFL